MTVGQISLTLPDPGEVRLQIRAITVHESYNLSKINDIAMLEVKLLNIENFMVLCYMPKLLIHSFVQTSQEMVFNSHVNFTYYNTVKPAQLAIMGWGATDVRKLSMKLFVIIA